MHLGATGPAEFAHAGFGGFEAEDPFEIGDRDEQRAVGVTFSQYCVDLEYRMSRVAGVDARAVVDDPLEDRQCPQPHATMLADVDPG